MSTGLERRRNKSLVTNYFAVLLILVVMSFPAPGGAVPAGSSETFAFADGVELQTVLAEALANNMDLQSAGDTARAFEAEIPLAGSLEDPRLGVGVANLPTDTFDFDQEPMTQKQIALAQKLPWFGTLDLSKERADLRAQEQQWLVVDARQKLVRQLKEAWYDLGFTEYSLTINGELDTIVDQMIQVAETRYATGEGLQQDILQGQVRLSELLERRIQLESNRLRLRNRIGALLNRESPFTEQISERLPESTVLPAPETLYTAALAASPELAVRRTGLLRAEKEVELARKKYAPDMDFRVSYGQREDDPVTGRDRADFFSAGVTINVPVWKKNRQDSVYQASLERLESAKNGVLAYERALPRRIDGLMAEYEGARQNQHLLGEAISVQNEQLADSSLAAYSVGKIEFATMLNARVAVLQSRLATRKYSYEMYKKLAELEELIGKPIEEIELETQ